METILIRISKLLLSIFIIYSTWYKETYGNVPLILYGTVILATSLVALCIIINDSKLPLNGFISMLFVYGIYSFVTGILISKDISWFLSLIVTYFAFILVCFDFFYITKHENSTDWILNTFKISALLCAFQTVFFGVDYQTEVLVKTMSVNNNPHTLGLVMILGIYAFTAKKKYLDQSIFKTSIIVLFFLYVITLSGSRTTLICAVALVIIWVLFLLNDKNRSKFKRILVFLATISMFFIGMYYISNYFFNTAIYERLLIIGSGANTRSELFKSAIDYWKQSPIIGIGFGQYQIWSPVKLYSHSVYAEILSCTGLLGGLLFFGIMFKYTIQLIKCNLFCLKSQKYDFRMALAMILIEWILGIGQIHIYSVVHLLILTYLAMCIHYIPKEYLESSSN